MQPYGCLSTDRAKTRTDRPSREERSETRVVMGYLRRWKRVRLSIFLCFFLRMRLRRFLISDPMARQRVVARGGLGKSHARVP